MKILIYGINYAPELTGVGKYTGEMAEWLAAQGHQVKVITAPPYYPYWKVQKPYSAWRYAVEQRNGVEVHRSPLWVPSGPSGIKRVLHLMSFPLFSGPTFVKLMRWKPDVVIAIEPTFFSVVLARFICRFYKVKSWLHVQDIELDAAFSLKILPGGGIRHFIKRAEGWVFRRYDRISSISSAMLNRLEIKGINRAKLVLFPNWTSELPASKSTPVELRKEFGIPENSKLVLYSGNIGHKQGLYLMPDVAKELSASHPEIFFLIVGEGPIKKMLEADVSRYGLKNVGFAPLQPLEKLSGLLALADAHLVLQRPQVADLVMPSKLGPIFSSGGAVLTNAEPGTEVFRLITENKLGIAVKSESASAIAEGLVLMFQDTSSVRDSKDRSRSYAKRNLTKDKILSAYERQLKSLLGLPVTVPQENAKVLSRIHA